MRIAGTIYNSHKHKQDCFYCGVSISWPNYFMNDEVGNWICLFCQLDENNYLIEYFNSKFQTRLGDDWF